MKKIISLVLVLCMLGGMVVTVSAAPASSFARTLNLVRLIRTMFNKDEDEAPEFGTVSDGKLVIYVAANGKKTATGTAKDPMTLEAARDAARSAKKSRYESIDIVLKAGNYILSETFTLTEEDSGTEDCPVRYIGEDGATIIGGVALSAKDFAPAAGDTTKYFPEADKIVQYDLKQIGVTAEQMAKYFDGKYFNSSTVRLFKNGEMQTVARYPNLGEDQIIIEYGSAEHPEGRERDWKDTMTFGIPEETIERMRSWNTYKGVFLSGYTDFLWRINDTPIIGISADKSEFYTLFPGTAAPRAGLEFFLYNIPEELDFPGEYYIDRDAILYYYPTEDFNTATLTIPVISTIISVEGADYTTFENLAVETSAGTGIKAVADNVTIFDCTISKMVHTAIDINGYNNLISTCWIYNTGAVAVNMQGGDEATLTPGNNLFTNNYVHDFGLLSRGYNGGITFGGCGNTVSHNEIFNGEHQGIHWSGTRNVIEYNYIHDVCKLCDDMGAIYGGGINMVDCTVRYNYIQNVGIPKESRLRKIKDYPYCGSHGAYWDMYNGNNNTYGNIFENIQGAGVAMGNGRNMYIADNLVISAQHVVTGICGIYVSAYYGTPSSHKNKLNDYMYNDIWTKEYPEMSKLVMDMTKTTMDDPLGWATPYNIVIKDNYFYGDKYNTGSRPGIIPLSLESPFYDWNPDTIIEIVEGNGNLTVINSKRDGIPEIKDALETAKDVVSITYEQFLEMGTDWKPEN